MVEPKDTLFQDSVRYKLMSAMRNASGSVNLAQLEAAEKIALERRLPDKLSPEIREVLGISPNATHGIAMAYRSAGHEIAETYEAEAAFVIWRFLGFALEHGEDYRAIAMADVQKAREGEVGNANDR